MLCKHFGHCGGCQTQDIPYTEQLKIKEDRLSRLFNQYIAVLPSPQHFFHRNKMEFVCGKNGIGLHEKEHYQYIIPINDCLLLSEESNDLLAFVHKLIHKYTIPLYDLETHQGLLRTIVIREGKFTGERMVNFITSQDYPSFQAFLQEFSQYFPATSINWLINNEKNDTSTGTLKQTIGREYINEQFDHITYRIYPATFFQTNSLAAYHLFKAIKQHIPEKSTVLDLYCGTGAISLFIADKAQHVHGIDVVKASIDAAQENTQHNNIHNVTFAQQDLNTPLPQQHYDVVIVDPPRTGLSEEVIQALFSIRPKRIISISCNPQTHRRDLSRLFYFYSLLDIKGHDLFPHTPHVETVAILELKK